MFSDDLALYVTNQFNLYAVQLGKDNLNILEEAFRTFIKVLLVTGYCKVLYQNIYWEDAPDTTMKQSHVQ